jgi:hypothetical protein
VDVSPSNNKNARASEEEKKVHTIDPTYIKGRRTSNDGAAAAAALRTPLRCRCSMPSLHGWTARLIASLFISLAVGPGVEVVM